MSKKIREQIAIKIVVFLSKILGIKVMAYILGIKLNLKPMFGNAGVSKNTYCIISCHPLDSITWHWAIYWTKYNNEMSWFKKMGFSISKQDIMRAA